MNEFHLATTLALTWETYFQHVTVTHLKYPFNLMFYMIKLHLYNPGLMEYAVFYVPEEPLNVYALLVVVNLEANFAPRLSRN